MVRSVKEFLNNCPEGLIRDVTVLEELLSKEWNGIEGSDEENTEGSKLRGRMEQVSWHPPLLSFTLERHGITVIGSTRAELHNWVVDISTWTAQIASRNRRQKSPIAKKMNTHLLAQTMVNVILKNGESEFLKRFPDGRVKVLIADIIPDEGIKETTSGRRKRFRKALEALICNKGWSVVGVNTYKQK